MTDPKPARSHKKKSEIPVYLTEGRVSFCRAAMEAPCRICVNLIQVDSPAVWIRGPRKKWSAMLHRECYDELVLAEPLLHPTAPVPKLIADGHDAGKVAPSLGLKDTYTTQLSRLVRDTKISFEWLSDKRPRRGWRRRFLNGLRPPVREE
jgi:hypothetical protein